MSRVGGNQINASSFSARFGEHPVFLLVKKYLTEAATLREKAQVQVLSRPDASGKRYLKTVVDGGIHFKLEAEMCARYTRALKRTLDQRPKIRTRKTGPVGPDLDWSVIYSNVPITIFHDPSEKRGSDYFGAGWPEEEGRLLFPADDDRLKLNTSGFRQHACAVGCVETHMMGPEEVRLWTQWAFRNGIHYSGERGYVRTKSTQAWSEDMSVNSFRQLKEFGFTAKHSRSEWARMRRAARRGKRNALIGATPVERLFVTRYRLTSNQIAEQWHKCEPMPRFQDFKQSLDKVITLFPRKCRLELSPIVYRSLKRIYSRPEKIVSGKLWFKPEIDLRYVLEVKSPPKKRIYQESTLFLRKGARVHEHGVEGVRTLLHTTIPRIERGTNPDYVTWSGTTRWDDPYWKRVGFTNRDVDFDFDEPSDRTDLGEAQYTPTLAWEW